MYEILGNAYANEMYGPIKNKIRTWNTQSEAYYTAFFQTKCKCLAINVSFACAGKRVLN